ncbi:hypothetical protein [Streptomyces sp. CBMA29]|uniref:hypothetical protein n=1 Tax=Streptomyces sp. CBMA29 TaxID=1896314 RepID=UPI0016620098|nr:hypothetical protein [Streptomyces sp. CBMA29]MBD0739402.1 hypothetical protein [Streptomyces sp. CBMA29]
MEIGFAGILLNHPVLIIGSTGFVEDYADVPLDGSVHASEVHQHLGVPALAQVAPVLIKLWRGPHTAVGETVFDGIVDLPDGTLAAFDVENVSRFTKKLGKPGTYHLTIRVDDPKRASRVDLVLDRGEGEVEIGTVLELSIPPIGGVTGLAVDADAALHLILSEHDLPLHRLANALDLILGEWVRDLSDASPRAEALRSARLTRLVHWLRGQAPWAPHNVFLDARASAEEQIVRASRGNREDFDAADAAADIIRSLKYDRP